MAGVTTSATIPIRPVVSADDLVPASRYRVHGILHDYVGSALLPDSHRMVRVFCRAEWRPNTDDQLAFTLVDDTAIPNSVTRRVAAGPLA